MSESKLRTQSMDFAVSIINLVKYLKEKRESIISNQIGRSGTSIGAAQAFVLCSLPPSTQQRRTTNNGIFY